MTETCHIIKKITRSLESKFWPIIFD